MKYFNKIYVNHTNFFPFRWLHLKSKLDLFTDPTNNTSETLNHVFKLSKSKNISFEELVRKIKTSIDYYFDIYENLEKYHNYQYTLERFIKDKLKRVYSNTKKIKQLEKNFILKKYK